MYNRLMDSIRGYSNINMLYEEGGLQCLQGFRIPQGEPVLIFKSAMPTNSEQESRFQQAYQMLRSLAHGSIPKSAEYFSIQNSPIIVLYAQGEPLETVLRKYKRPAKDAFLDLALELVDAFAFLESKRICYNTLGLNQIFYDGIQRKFLLPAFTNALDFDESCFYDGHTHRPSPWKTDLLCVSNILLILLLGSDAFSEIHWNSLHVNPLPQPDLSALQLTPSMKLIAHKLFSKEATQQYKSFRGLYADLKEATLAMRQKAELIELHIEEDISPYVDFSTTWVQRKQAMGTLNQALEESLLGDKKTIFITGEAGSGKTLLVEQFFANLKSASFMVAELRFISNWEGNLYQTIHTILIQLLQRILQWPSDSRKAFFAKMNQDLGNDWKIIEHYLPLELLSTSANQHSPLAEKDPLLAMMATTRFLRELTAIAPIVLHIDNLQWADHQSLRLLEAFQQDMQLHHILVLHTYRPDDPQQPEEHKIYVEQFFRHPSAINIHLPPFDFQETAYWLGCLFTLNNETRNQWASELYTITQGNPLFLKQLLQQLLVNKNIFYCQIKLCWQFNEVPFLHNYRHDNLAVFLEKQIMMLKSAEKKTILFASCLKTSFHTKQVAHITEEPESEVIAAFLHLEYRGFIKKDLVSNKNSWVFGHDRIQQTCYDLLSETQKSSLHAKVANYIYNNDAFLNHKDKLIHLCNHILSSSQNLLQIPAYDAFRIFAAATQVANRSRSSRQSLAFSEKALALLPEVKNLVQTPDLLWEIHIAFLDSCQYTHQYQKGLAHIYTIPKNGLTSLQQMMLASFEMRFHMLNGDNDLALNTGLKALNQNSLKLPNQNARKLRAFFEIYLARRSLKTQTSPFHLRRCGEEDAARLNILIDLCIICYITKRETQGVCLTSYMARHALQAGQSGESAYALMSYAALEGAILNNHKLAINTSQTAMSILHDKSHYLYGRTLFTYYCFIAPWNEDWNKLPKGYDQAYQCSLKSGDMMFVAEGSLNAVLWNYTTVVPDLIEKMNASGRLINSVDARHVEQLYRIHYDFFQLLQSGEDVTSYQIISDHHHYNHMKDCIQLYRLASLHFTHGNYEEFAKNILTAWNHRLAVMGMMDSVEILHQILLFILLKQAPRTTIKEALPPKILKEVSQCVTIWYKHAPAQFNSFALLNSAIKAMQDLRPGDALLNLSEALDYWRERSYWYYWAQCAQAGLELSLQVAQPVYASFFAQQLKAALQYGQCYGWQNACQHRYEHLPLNTEDPVVPLTQNNINDLSQQSIQFVQAFSECTKESDLHRIMLGHFLKKYFITEAYICFPNSEQWRTLALNKAHPDSLSPLPPDGELPWELLRYAAAVNLPQVLLNASQDIKFRHVPYFRKHGVFSVMCLPISGKKGFIGCLYLESKKMPGLFNDSDLEWAHFILRQYSLFYEHFLLLENLNGLVQTRTHQLEESQKNHTEILNSIDVAIVTLNSDGSINPGYSRKTEEIFHLQAGKTYNFVSLFHLNSVNQKYFIDWLDLLFSSSTPQRWNKYQQLAPLKEYFVDFGLKKVTLQMDFQPIWQEKKLHKLLVLIRDISAQKYAEEQLQTQKKEQEKILEVISALFGHHQGILHSFMEAALSFYKEYPIDSFAESMLIPTQKEPFLRSCHSLKALAGSIGLKNLSTQFHLAEEVIEQSVHMKKDWSAEVLSIMIHLREDLQQLRGLYEKFMGTNKTGELILDRTGLCALIKQYYHSGRKEDVAKILALNALPFDQLAARYKALFSHYVKSLNKQAQPLELPQQSIPVLLFEKIDVLLVHLLRNAVDHGLETEADRIAHRKPLGMVNIQLEISDHSYCIEVFDNGRGVHTSQILSQAINKGLVSTTDAQHLSDVEITQLIFIPGFSTRRQATEISGRGMGLDVVKTGVEALGGSIQIHSAPNQGARFVLQVPIDFVGNL
jgi:signal transduction histidine kinase/GAF domain-containing protein